MASAAAMDDVQCTAPEAAHRDADTEAFASQSFEAPQQLPPPLVVTIGPQCSGKTTLLRKYLRIKDVAIDDVPGVYEKVPIEALVSAECLELVPDVNVYRRPLRERVMEVQGSEQGLITQRIFGLMPADQFAYFIRPLVQSDIAYTYLCEVLEELLLLNLPLTRTVDIFIPDARTWAVRAAQTRLREALADRSRAVGWGNTNLSPKEYKTALWMAFETGRPVEFVCWGREIPKVETKELIYRNVARYIQTGKYIPVDIVVGYVQRAEQLLASTNGGDPAELAKLARFTLLENGLVQPTPFVQENTGLVPSPRGSEHNASEHGEEGRGSTGSAGSFQSDGDVQCEQASGAHTQRRKFSERRRERRSRSQSPHTRRR